VSHWLDGAAGILTAETGDLRKLAQIAGYDPKTYYKYQDLSGCDLRGQNLTGMDFSNCKLDQAIIDEKTIIDQEFDPRIKYENPIQLKVRISSDLNTLVLHYMQSKNLKNRDTTYHRLLREGYECICSKRFNFYSDIIDKNFNLSELLKIKKTSSLEIKLNFDFRLINEVMNKYGEAKSLNRIILVSLIRKRIKYNSRKDYSNVSPNAFYPPKLVRVEFNGRYTS
jgi:Pentapeptide repeats (8 copies)